MTGIGNFFEGIVKTVAGAAVFLIIAGYVDLAIYYSRFNIQINQYIDASEIILTSIDKLGTVIAALITQMIIWSYLFDYLFDYDLEASMSDGKRRPIKYHDETGHRLVNSAILKIYGLILLGLVILSIALVELFPRVGFLNVFKEYIGMNFWITLMLYMWLLQATRALWLRVKGKSEAAKLIVILIVFSVVLFCAIWLNNTLSATRIQRKGNTQHISIYLSDGSVTNSNDTLRFVGRTREYVFFWNSKSKQTSVFPQSDIRKIVTRGSSN